MAKTGALAAERPKAGAGSRLGDRTNAPDAHVDYSAPPWHAWRTRSRAARAIRWIETYCRIPSGVGTGRPMRLHRFQRESLEQLLGDGVRTGGLQIPRGNAKSTLWAAVGLWAVCDGTDTPQVPLVAYNGLQANRTLLRPIRTMVRMAPELAGRVVVYTSANDRRVWSPWNDGELLPLPADVDRLQGLNPSLALIDEAQTVTPEVLASVLQGAGKRTESLVLAIGTPSPGGQESALYALRSRAGEGARVVWVEYAAAAGCDLADRAAWRQANPALAAGMLHEDVLAAEVAIVSAVEFRAYRLGQWVDAVMADWLPAGAWDACPHSEVPVDGAEVVLGLAGTWSSSVALVGGTPDGLFVAWAAETATDDELQAVIETAAGRWQVSELVAAPKSRVNLLARLEDSGVPVTVWPNRTDVDAASAAGWRQAIVDGRMAHDHHPLLAEHVAATVARSGSDGALRLVAPDDKTPCDAARAARMVWWRLVDTPRPDPPTIY